MISYLEYYHNTIAPKLKEIDISIKCGDAFTIDIIAGHLDLEYEEIRLIMEHNNLSAFDKQTFFTIMEHGSSEICRLYARELKCGSPFVYTREEIAYIYDINIELIDKACDELNYHKITSYSLPQLFTMIPYDSVRISNTCD